MANLHYTERINDFFAHYAIRFTKALAGEDDVKGVTASFADCFIEANPFGVNCGKNDERFRDAIPKGNEYYRKLGTKEMSITAIESSQLDNNHYMAKIEWHSLYQKDDESISIDFSVIYLLQELDNKLTIFAYLTGDEQSVLKEHGLL